MNFVDSCRGFVTSNASNTMHRQFLLLLILVLFALPAAAQSSYDVVEIYQSESVPSGIKVLTSNEEVDDLSNVVELLLKETSLEEGLYEVELTRKGSNLYKIDGTSLYIKTRYCYEYSYGEEVILKIESAYGYTKGQVIWP